MEGVIQALQLCLSNNNLKGVEKYELFISSDISSCIELPEFYELPIDCFCSIMKRSGILKDVETVKLVIERLYKSELNKKNVPLILNVVELPEASAEDCLAIIAALSSSPLCVRFGEIASFDKKEENATQNNENLMREIQEKDEIIQSLRSQLASMNQNEVESVEILEENPPIEEKEEIIEKEEKNEAEIVPLPIYVVKKPYFHEENIFLAIQNDKFSSVQYLIQENRELLEKTDEEGRTPLFVAVQCDNYKAVSFLINEGANRTVKNEKGNSLIHEAARINSYKIIDLLKQWNANVEEKNNYGATPLLVAAENGSFDAVRFLVEGCGANIDGQQEGKLNTPLIFAVNNNHIDIVRYLCENNANVNIQNKEGKTALFFAALNDNIEIVQFLLTHGADKTIKTEDGDTPYDIADCSNSQMLSLLSTNGKTGMGITGFVSSIYNSIIGK